MACPMVIFEVPAGIDQMNGTIDTPKGWNVGRSRTYKWVRAIVLAAVFGLIEYGNRRGYYSLNVSQYLVLALCAAGYTWFWKVARPEERSWRRTRVRNP